MNLDRPIDESLDYTRARRVLSYGDLEPAPSLKLLFEDVRDFIAAQDTRVNRDEFILIDLANLLMCKLLDERDRRDFLAQPMQFQMQNPEIATPDHIRRLFIQIRNQSVGDAFQVLRGRAVKGDEGQYFTPGPVVRAAVRIINPTSTERAIDPACGTGGFVTTILDYVYEQLEQSLSGVEATVRKQRWASERLYAIDKDAVSVRFAKSYLALLNNGGHVYQADSLRTYTWGSRHDDLSHQVRNGGFDND